MANITAADVKRLRDLTGAGMMDSKKALEEADGDFERAAEILRVKGAAKAAKRGAERTASAGLVAASGSALVELNSETDFVAKSEAFVDTAQRIADAADRAKPADDEALKAVPLGDSTVGETVANSTTVISTPTIARPTPGTPCELRRAKTRGNMPSPAAACAD